MSEEIIKREKSYLRKFKETLLINDEYQTFIYYVKEKNEEERLEIYRSILRKKITKAKTDEDILKYKKLLDNSENDIKTIRIKGYKEFTAATIFDGIDINAKRNQFRYTGFEKFIEKNMLGILLGAIANAVILATIFTNFKNTTDAWARIVSIIVMFINNIIKGINYAKYSVKEVYSAVLNERKTFVMNYFMKSGYEITIPDETQIMSIKHNKEIENKEYEIKGDKENELQ